jgi:hypothetical protein
MASGLRVVKMGQKLLTSSMGLTVVVDGDLKVVD